MTGRILAATLLSGLASLVACGHGAPSAHVPGRFPARPEGCPVEVSEGAPSAPADGIGGVSARCGDSVSDADCQRVLQDQVCKLGGDLVWGVTEETTFDGHKKLTGRAMKKR